MFFVAYVFCAVEYLKERVVLDNCYDPDTSAHLTSANKSICIRLIPTMNEACNVLQNGINISVDLIVPNSSANPPTTTSITTLFGYHYDFAYNKTTEVCIDAENPQNASTDFHQAQTIRVTFDSIGYNTTFIAGLVQKITGDNSALIQMSGSTVRFDKNDLCFSSTLNTNFVGNFDNNHILNATVTITGYYPEKEETSFVKIHNNTTNGSNITYDSSQKLFNICFSNVNALRLYASLYRSVSRGYLQIFYQINNTTSGTNMPSVLQLYQGTSMVYDFTGKDQIYKQMNVIIMPNYVALQIVLDPTKETKRMEYQKLLREQQPNHTAIKQIILFCSEASHNKMVVYTKNNINFINASQLFKFDIFQPNESITGIMEKIWEARNTPGGCTPVYEYHLFGFNQSNSSEVIMQYRQRGNYTQYTCFKHVKYSIQGRLEFIRNDINCTWLNHSQTVTMKIINEITRQEEGIYEVHNFSINQLNYQIPLDITINVSIMTLQILNKSQTMIEQIELLAVSEAALDVMKEKGIPIIIFGVFQILCILVQVVIKKIVLPRLVAKIQERKMIKYKAKHSMFDL